jgi:polyphosphate glucokinase
MEVLGIDIGGSGIKGAIVDTTNGTLTQERYRLETPQPATPEAMVETIGQIAEHFEWKGKPIGSGFPGVVQHGVIKTAANIDKSWIGQNAETLIKEATGASLVHVLNDADAAGLAEVKFGAGVDVKGIVLMITLGTGIGSGLYIDGILVPNTELGHIEVDGHPDAEHWAADSAREREDLKWGEWAKRVNVYLNQMHKLFWPDLIVIGGGVSKKSEKFFPHIDVPCKVVAATLLNDAGIVGAAVAAAL